MDQSNLDSSSLTLDDGIDFIPPPPEDIDQETAKSIMNYRKTIFNFRIKKVNTNIIDFLKIWPRGRPVDFFIALEFCKDDTQIMKEKLKDQTFIKTIIEESSKRCFKRKPSAEYGIANKYLFEINEDKLFEDEKQTIKKEWRRSEVVQFKRLYLEYGKDFKSISHYLKTKSVNQCRYMYAKLSKNGRLPNMDESSDHEYIDDEFSINSLSFVFNGATFKVGEKQTKLQKYIFLNPIPGHIDQITMQPMQTPTISKDGYVLDYSTWLKLLTQKKVNPFYTNHIKSKRELVILTTDNFSYYKDKIVNLEETNPNN